MNEHTRCRVEGHAFMSGRCVVCGEAESNPSEATLIMSPRKRVALDNLSNAQDRLRRAEAELAEVLAAEADHA